MQELYATIDLGSNSFHMLTAALEHNEIKILYAESDKVMLADGLNKKEGISEIAMQRGIDCITRFHQRLKNIPKQNIRIVGTNTLRAAVNSKDYVAKLEQILDGIPINIVSGIEEARLVYLGVNHSWSCINQMSRSLVVDIGGGSTEFIIGKDFKLKQAESLRMGCIAFKRYFPNNQISERNFNLAVDSAKFELNPILSDFKPKKWQNVIGSAGTFKAIERILIEMGLTSEGIDLASLKQLKATILKFKNTDKLILPGLKPTRQTTIVPGIAITLAIFKRLQIEKMFIARGGLREGVLYDLLGRLKSEDVRSRSINALCRRYHVNEDRRKLLVKITANLARNLITKNNPLPDSFFQYLMWAAQCCRVGLAINHSQYQKHSAYLIKNSELSGFTLKERNILAAIVYNHRRGIDLSLYQELNLPEMQKQHFILVVFFLRLANIISQNGKNNRSDHLTTKLIKNGIQLGLDKEWLEKHAYIRHAIKIEINYWQKAGLKLRLTYLPEQST